MLSLAAAAKPPRPVFWRWRKVCEYAIAARLHDVCARGSRVHECYLADCWLQLPTAVTRRTTGERKVMRKRLINLRACSMFILVQKSYLERPDPQTIDARHLETKGALHAIDRTNSTTSPRRHRTGRVGKFLDQGPRLAPAKRRRRRAGDDVRAARASFVIIAGEPNPSPPLQHVEEQLFFVRGGFFTCAASRSEFSNVVPRRRRDGCGLGRFAHLDVRRGLRRTRVGARA